MDLMRVEEIDAQVTKLMIEMMSDSSTNLEKSCLYLIIIG